MRITQNKYGYRLVLALESFTLLIYSSFTANATDIDPKSYSNIPVNVNFLTFGYAYTTGSVSFPPPVPISNGKLDFHTAIAAYSRSLDIFGLSGKIDAILPAAWISGKADVLDEPQSRNISGFADPRVRFYVNFFGAPAMSMKDFSNYRQNLIVGGSLTVVAPGGQYDPDKVINVGSNRWAFKPELGMSKTFGPLTVEVATGAYFFTENSQPFQGNTQQQDPLFTFQGHLIYNFVKGIWGAFDVNYYNGGRTQTDNKSLDNRLESWRVGSTLSLPVSRQHSIKLYGSTSIYNRIGSDFDIVGIAWQYRWGGGF